jgi:transposase-like protein
MTGVTQGAPRPGGFSEVLTEPFLRTEYVAGRRSLADIARQVGCSPTTVRKHVMKAGLPLTGKREFVGVLTEKFLRHEVLAEKRSVAAIAERVGCAPSTVDFYLRELGFDLPAVSQRSDAVELTDVLTPAFLHREYVERGRSAFDIAHDVGCSTSAIADYLRRAGIRARRRRVTVVGHGR